MWTAIILSLILGAYVASIAGATFFFTEMIKRKVSVWGKQKGLTSKDVLICFLPVLNTIVTVQALRGQFHAQEEPKEIVYNLADEEEDDYYKVRE